MDDTEITLALISTIAAAVSAGGGLLATFAAFRSAGLANKALREAAALERRRACDALIELAQRVTAEHAGAVALLKKLEEENRNYADLTGNQGGSWLAQKLRDLATTREEQAPIRQRAADQISSYRGLLKLSEDDLAELSSKLFADLARLRVTKEDLRDQLNNVREQNQLHRARTLGSIPRIGDIGT